MRKRCLIMIAALSTAGMHGYASGKKADDGMAEAPPPAAVEKALNKSLGALTQPETTEQPQGGTSVSDQIKAYIDEQKTAGAINTDDPSWRTKLPKFPEVQFDDGKTYYWSIETTKGPIKAKLLSDTAPNHTANFIYLTELGFFDGLNFHRVIKGFMAQGGCPEGSGRGNPGYRFEGEFDPSVKHDRPGLLSMANAGPGTDGSQFFLTFVPTPWLDGKHTIFGEVVEGMENVEALEAAGSPDGSGRTAERLVIESAVISAE